VDEGDVSGLASIVGGLLGLATTILLAWWTIIAFAGGTMPIIGYETEGGIGTGLLWLFIIDPIAATVLYWIGMAVAMPVLGVVWAARRR
jgi:hypothetical protein